MLLSPGLPWVRIGLVAILSLAIGAAGFETGRRWVLADWNAEKAAQAEAKAAAAAAAMEDSRRQAVAQRARDNAYESQLRSISGRLADALVSLHNRPARLPEPARAACAGATGAELSGPDAAFLEREAARADTLRAALARCQGQTDPDGQVNQ